MTDRELLELAAKAAGLRHPDGFDWIRSESGFQWNPLEDDGDALRLAVKLELDVSTHGAIIGDKHAVMVQNGASDDYQLEPHGDDMFAAVRRAIVHAASEIGKAMP